MPVQNAAAIVITYHFLRQAGFGRFQLRAHETPIRFRRQVREVSKRFSVCGTRELLDPLSDSAGSQVAFHFDDGAADIVREALPILVDHEVTATVFVCSRPYLEGRLLGVQKVEYLVHRLGLERFSQAFYEELARRFPTGVVRESLDFANGYLFYRYDELLVREFKLDLNYRIPYCVVDPVLDALFEATFGTGSESEAVRETYLSTDDIKRLVDSGIEIGAHTHSHRVLPRLDFDSQKSEIGIGLEFVRQLSGESNPSVTYPFGFSDGRTEQAMRESGASAGFSVARRCITPDDIEAQWDIPRFDVNDCFDRDANQPIPHVFDSLAGADRDPIPT